MVEVRLSFGCGWSGHCLQPRMGADVAAGLRQEGTGGVPRRRHCSVPKSSFPGALIGHPDGPLKHVLHCSERALVASQITPTSAPALDSSSMSRAARGSAVGGHERRCSTLRLLRRCSRPPRCHHLAASHVAAAPPLLRHAAGQRRAWLRSASRSVSSCSLDEFMSDERCSACLR